MIGFCVICNASQFVMVKFKRGNAKPEPSIMDGQPNIQVGYLYQQSTIIPGKNQPVCLNNSEVSHFCIKLCVLQVQTFRSGRSFIPASFSEVFAYFLFHPPDRYAPAAPLNSPGRHPDKSSVSRPAPKFPPALTLRSLPSLPAH